MVNTYEYNEGAINLCGNFAENFFKNFEQYKDKYTQDIIFASLSFEDIEKRNALENYILKHYTSLPSNSNEKKNMDRYLTVFYKRFLYKPTQYLESPFLKSPKIVEEFCPQIITLKDGNKTVNIERKKVAETYIENTREPDKLYIRDRNLDNLSTEETNRLMHYFIKNIGTADKKIQDYQEAYIKKMINRNPKVKDLNPKQIEFIAKYINDKMLTWEGYKEKGLKDYIYIGEGKENLGGFENQNNIYINKNSILTQDIPRLIQVICHETEHSIQKFQAKGSADSKIGLDLAISNILRNYYTTQKGYNVYEKNYRFEQIEQDAEKEGTRYAKIILSTLGFSDLSKKLGEIQKENIDSRQFEYDYRVDENGRKSTREAFIFNNLNSIIKQNPSLISEYPALTILYNQNGQVKLFEEIISGDFKFNDDAKNEILQDFCKYYISKGELDKIDLSKFPEAVQANIASRLIAILLDESDKIRNMGREKKESKYWGQINEEDRRHVEEFHLKNSRNIMQFINKNYQHLIELQDLGKFSSIIDMSNYNSCVNSYIYDRKYENLAYNNFDNIEQLKKLAIEAIKQKEAYREEKAKIKKTETRTTGQDIGQASFDATVEECDKAQAELDSLIQTKENSQKGSE